MGPSDKTSPSASSSRKEWAVSYTQSDDDTIREQIQQDQAARRRLFLVALMLTAGALAGLAGGVEVLGVHRRLIEGFSLGFGFKAVTVALLGAIEPLAVVPAALFVGLLESGSLAMQRQIGVPSALVTVIEGLTMLYVLAATVVRK